MKMWTPDASDHFESWLGRVRHTVAADPAVDPDDIAQDLRAHVHAELEAMPEPVTVGTLERVLETLGNPAQWSDAQAAPNATRRWHRVSVGDLVTRGQRALAGEWGMPVLLAALTALALAGLDDGGVVLLAAAYFIARSQIVYGTRPLTGGTRNLVYLPLAIGAGLLTVLVLGFPVLLRDSGRGVSLRPEDLLVLGGWWIVVGAITAREPKRVQAVLRPFAGGFDPAHGRFLAVIGGALLTASMLRVIF